jgi:hypothetical protein
LYLILVIYTELTFVALQSIYPEHKSIWEAKRPHGYWKDIGNQRAFLERIAKKYDVQKPEDWYKIQAKGLLKEDGGYLINAYYNGSLVQGNSSYISLNTAVVFTRSYTSGI